MRKRRISAILAMALAGSMVLAGCGGSDFTLANENVTLELGETLSEKAADYVKFKDNVSEEKQEEILSDTTVDLSGVDQDAIGEYEAMVVYDGKNLSFTVQVQDTKAPAASLVHDIAEAHTGVEVTAADLVTDIVDAQDVMVKFVTSSAAPAEFEIPSADTAEDAEVAEGDDADAVEAETPDESAQTDGEDARNATDATNDADVAYGESTDAVLVKGETNTTETVIGEELAETYTFQAAGQYEITIRLTDASGNSTDLVQKVNVTDPDVTAPVIEGVDDITVYLNNEPDYLDGVSASDDVDGDLTGSIVVDSSAVDVSTVGTYTATYSVKDAAGNETIETITVSVVRKTKAPTATTTTTQDAVTTPQASTDNGSSGGGASSGSSSNSGSSSSSGGSSSSGSSSTPSTPSTPSTDGDNSGSVSSGGSNSTDTGASDPGSIFDQMAQDAGANTVDNPSTGDHADNAGSEIEQGFH